MKLIVLIPCYNESETLPRVFLDMPKSISGINQIEFLVVDDGCTDDTIEVARGLGVHHIISSSGINRRWLGHAFRIGIEEAMRLGADLVVTTDGDGQYPSALIPQLVEPIVSNKADLAIGNRFCGSPTFYSLQKTIFSKIGNTVISKFTGHSIPDALSGFRAYSLRSLEQLNVISNQTYTIDTLMQAYQNGLVVTWIDIFCNPPSRPSRLFRSPMDAVKRSAPNIIRSFIHHRPFGTIFPISLILFFLGSLLFGRFIFIVIFTPLESSGHIQSLIAGAVCIVSALQLAALAILGDILKVIRSLQEETLRILRNLSRGQK